MPTDFATRDLSEIAGENDLNPPQPPLDQPPPPARRHQYPAPPLKNRGRTCVPLVDNPFEMTPMFLTCTDSSILGGELVSYASCVPSEERRSVPEHQELAKALATAFTEKDDADVVLLRNAGFPMDQRPAFSNPLAFWSTVVQHASVGILHGGLNPILREAARQRPASDAFKSYTDLQDDDRTQKEIAHGSQKDKINKALLPVLAIAALVATLAPSASGALQPALMMIGFTTLVLIASKSHGARFLGKKARLITRDVSFRPYLVAGAFCSFVMGLHSCLSEHFVPTIVAIHPSHPLPGAIVTLVGRNFPRDSEAVAINFGGLNLDEVVSSNSTEIVFRVPSDARAGPVEMQLKSPWWFSMGTRFVFSVGDLADPTDGLVVVDSVAVLHSSGLEIRYSVQNATYDRHVTVTDAELMALSISSSAALARRESGSVRLGQSGILRRHQGI